MSPLKTHRMVKAPQMSARSLADFMAASETAAQHGDDNENVGQSDQHCCSLEARQLHERQRQQLGDDDCDHDSGGDD